MPSMSSQNAVISPLLPEGAEATKTPAGTPVVAHVHSPEVERRALAEGSLLVDQRWRSLLRIGGEDRVRFVNGLMTCDLKPLADGAGTYGFFTDPKGRVLSDAVVFAASDALYVDVPADRAEAIVDHLTKYIITDRVEPVVLKVRSLLLAGPQAVELWNSLSGAPAPSGSWFHGEASLEGVAVRVADERRIGVSALSVWVPEESAAELFGRLSAESTAGGWRAVDACRIEAGLPWFGIDFDEQNIPQETSLQTAVSFEKGCYLGQEVVARVHFLGKASRTLHPVRFHSESSVTAGDEMGSEGRNSGLLTSVSRVTDEGSYAGIASIHRRAIEAGDELSLADGAVVEVSNVDGL